MLAARWLLPLLLIAPGAALEVELRAPVVTVVAIPGEIVPGAKRVRARVEVPADAPPDLGVGAWVADRHGRWYQRFAPGALAPGRHDLDLPLAGAIAEGHGGAWNPAEAEKSVRGGLFFWTAGGSRARLRVDELRALPDAAPGGPERLLDLRLDGGAAPAIATGERWQATVLPQPFPADPYDREQFSLDLVVTAPDGRETRHGGFLLQPMTAEDGGDRERLTPRGAARFAVRFRPRQPGAHRQRLEARWRGGSTLVTPLPDLQATGAPWDGYVRVDAQDRRFLAAGGAWWWPVGPNLRSVWDERCRKYLGTALTPDRGTIAYRAYLDRLAAAGVNAVEVWLCSWNLALEWRADWPGYHGIGRYSEENAWRIDRLLDDAWARGVRINLVIYNHGMASEQTDAEWSDNPWSAARGGPLAKSDEYFTDGRALAGQERLRRYVIARWADHPAVMAWKLWSEINLTGAARSEETLRTWHERATARWHELDPYGHPCTTHWAGDFRAPHRSIVALPGIDLVCIDAYHAPEGEGGGTLLADLLLQSTGSGERRGGGLARYGKPVLATEYGGSWNACPAPQMEAEHASGAFAALVTGHAGAPMLWWFEWIDQGARFAPYRAITRFVAGEDLRDPRGASLGLTGASPAGVLWARAWTRPGRMLGYVQDRGWGANGGRTRIAHDQARIATPTPIAPGRLQVEWWDADTGERLDLRTVEHPGGPLTLDAPRFERHIAFKTYRVRDG